MKIRARLIATLQSAGVVLNAILLAAFPFADQIMQGISDNLPALAAYLPPNIYKWVGLAVVVVNIARAAHAAGKTAKVQA